MARTEKTALVTGASAGLGAELAKLFAADGPWEPRAVKSACRATSIERSDIHPRHQL